ncbi:MAG: universal stress protein [Phocaeicola sp.]
MEDKLVTLAILTYAKAQILKNILENEGIESYIHNVNLIQPIVSAGVRVRIKESDLARALLLIDDSSWLTEMIDTEQNDSKDASKMAKVLIPVDFSDYSLMACKFGFSFAHAIDAEVILLHAYFSPIYSPTIPYGSDGFSFELEQERSVKTMLESVHVELNKLADTVKQKIEVGEYPPVKFRCVLRDGVPEEEILRYAKKHQPVITVMGSRGSSKKEVDLIGSVTAEVIDRCKGMVYVVPEGSQNKVFKEIKRVAFLTNFDQRDLLAFDKLFFPFKDTHRFVVSFVHIGDKKNEWSEVKLAGIKDYFQKQYPTIQFSYNLITENSILNSLDSYVKSEQIDVICVTNYRRNIMARLFNPSIAHRMIFHSTTPILVLK